MSFVAISFNRIIEWTEVQKVFNNGKVYGLSLDNRNIDKKSWDEKK